MSSVGSEKEGHMTITTYAHCDVMSQSLSAFLRALEGQNRSTATLTAYRTDLLQFFTYLKANNLIANSPERVVRADIEEFLTWCARHGISGTSRARKLAAVRMYFRYLVAHDVIVRSPADGIATPRKERHTRTFYQPHEYHEILSLAGSIWWLSLSRHFFGHISVHSRQQRIDSWAWPLTVARPGDGQRPRPAGGGAK
jgi:Phage integrase, N-terminal SAM-like domain